MQRYEVVEGLLVPATDHGRRGWRFTDRTGVRTYDRVADALIDFVETGDGLPARFERCVHAIAARDAGGGSGVPRCGFGVVVWEVGGGRGSAHGPMHERHYTTDEWGREKGSML